MIRAMILGDVRKNFGDVINEVRYRHDSIVLQKGSQSIAAIVDIELFEKMNKLRLNFDKLCHEIGQVYQDVPTAEAEADVKEALSSLKEKN